jgi:nitrogen regulatory protein P-II 2
MNATSPVRLVTIVAEAVLEASILALLRELGVSGHTSSEARGEGSRGRRTGELPGDNVRIETLVLPETAATLMDEVSRRWFEDFAIVAWVTEVEVVRGGKFR